MDVSATESHADENLSSMPDSSISTSISADSLASPLSSSSSAMLTSSSSSTLTPTSASVVNGSSDISATPTPLHIACARNLLPETASMQTDAVECAPYVAHLAAFRFWQQRDSENCNSNRSISKLSSSHHHSGADQIVDSHRQRHLTSNNTRSYLDYAAPPRIVSQMEADMAPAEADYKKKSSPSSSSASSVSARAPAAHRNKHETGAGSMVSNADIYQHRVRTERSFETEQTDVSEHIRMRKTIMDHLRSLERCSTNCLPAALHAPSTSSAVIPYAENSSSKSSSSERETQQRMANATRYAELKQQLAHIDNELSHLIRLSSLPLVSSPSPGGGGQNAALGNGSSTRHPSATEREVTASDQSAQAALDFEHASRSGVGTSCDDVHYTGVSCARSRRASHSSVAFPASSAVGDALMPFAGNQIFSHHQRTNDDANSHVTVANHSSQPASAAEENNQYRLLNSNYSDHGFQQQTTVAFHGVSNNHNNKNVHSSYNGHSQFSNTQQQLPADHAAGDNNPTFANADAFPSMNDVCNEFERNRITLLALSRDQESCMHMRQAGTWVPQMVQIMYTNNCDLTSAPLAVRRHAREILYNLVYSMPDDKRGKRERRIFELLDRIRTYSEQCMYEMQYKNGNGPSPSVADVAPKLSPNPTAALAALLKRSFEEFCRHTICLLGGLQAVCEILQVDELAGQKAQMSPTAAYSDEQQADADDASNLRNKRRKWCAMILTNLTCHDGVNKALVCSSRGTMHALVSLISSSDATLCQSATAVMSNLTWRPDMRSKEALLDCGVAVAVMRAAMRAADADDTVAVPGNSGHGANLKNLLSTLWNLSSHGDESKSTLCNIPGVLNFLIDLIAACSATLMPSMSMSSTHQAGSPSVTSAAAGGEMPKPSSTSRSTTSMSVSASSATGSSSAAVDTLAILENTTGLLRNLAACVAANENNRQIMRDRGAFCLLLKQLCSSSLTVVTNVCGILANLSQNCVQDQALLLHFGAMKLLRPLTSHKNKLINVAACATTKNLLQAQAVLRDRQRGGVRTPFSNGSSPSPFDFKSTVTSGGGHSPSASTANQQYCGSNGRVPATPPSAVVHVMQRAELAAINRYYQNSDLLNNDTTGMSSSNGFSRGLEMTDAAVRDRMNMDMYVLENVVGDGAGGAEPRENAPDGKISDSSGYAPPYWPSSSTKSDASSYQQQQQRETTQSKQSAPIVNGAAQQRSIHSQVNDCKLLPPNITANFISIDAVGSNSNSLPKVANETDKSSKQSTDEFDDFAEMEIMPNVSMMLPLHRSPRSRKALVMTMSLPTKKAEAADQKIGEPSAAQDLGVPSDAVSAVSRKFDDKLTVSRSSGSGGGRDNDNEDQVRSYATEGTPILSTAGSLDDLSDLIKLGAARGRAEENFEMVSKPTAYQPAEKQPALPPRKRTSPLPSTGRQSMRVVSRGCRNHHQTPMVFSRSSSIDSLLVASERVSSNHRLTLNNNRGAAQFAGASSSVANNNEELESVYTPLLTGRVSPNDLPDTPAMMSPPPIQQRRLLAGRPTAISSGSRLQSKPLYEFAPSQVSTTGVADNCPNPSVNSSALNTQKVIDKVGSSDAGQPARQPPATAVHDGQKQTSDDATPHSSEGKCLSIAPVISGNNKPAPVTAEPSMSTSATNSHKFAEKQFAMPAQTEKLAKRNKSRSRSSQRRTSCVGNQNKAVHRDEQDAAADADDDDDAWLAECIYGALPKKARDMPKTPNNDTAQMPNRPVSAQHDDADVAAQSRKDELARQLRRSGKERRSLRAVPSANTAVARARVAATQPQRLLQGNLERRAKTRSPANPTNSDQLREEPPPLPRRRSPSNIRQPQQAAYHNMPQKQQQLPHQQTAATVSNKSVLPVTTEARSSKTQPPPPMTSTTNAVKKPPLDEPPPLPPRPARLPVPTSLSITTAAASDKTVPSPSRVILSTFASPTTPQTAIATSTQPLSNNSDAPIGFNLLELARSAYSTSADDEESDFNQHSGDATAAAQSLRIHKKPPAPIRSQRAAQAAAEQQQVLNGKQAGVADVPPVPPKAGSGGGARVVKPVTKVSDDAANERSQTSGGSAVLSSPKAIRGRASAKKPDCLKPPKIPVILTKALEAKMHTHSPTFCASRTSSVTTTPRSFSRQRVASGRGGGESSTHSTSPSSNSRPFDRQQLTRSSVRASVRSRLASEKQQGQLSKPVTGLEALSALENNKTDVAGTAVGRFTITAPHLSTNVAEAAVAHVKDEAVTGGGVSTDDKSCSILVDKFTENESFALSELAATVAVAEIASCADAAKASHERQQVITTAVPNYAAVLPVQKSPSSLASKLVSAFGWSRTSRSMETNSNNTAKQRRSESLLASPAVPIPISSPHAGGNENQRMFRVQRKSTESAALKTRTNKIESSRSVEHPVVPTSSTGTKITVSGASVLPNGERAAAGDYSDGVAYLTWTKKTKKPNVVDDAQQENVDSGVRICA